MWVFPPAATQTRLNDRWPYSTQMDHLHEAATSCKRVHAASKKSTRAATAPKVLMCLWCIASLLGAVPTAPREHSHAKSAQPAQHLVDEGELKSR